MAIPIPAEHIARFEKMGFGMFAHWGLYSQLGIGEWAYHIHKLNRSRPQDKGCQKADRSP